MKHYASLIGPLLGLYYPLSDDMTNIQQRVAMNSSKLKSLWHSIYSKEEVERQIKQYGGQMLPDEFADRLDYDSWMVQQAGSTPVRGHPGGL